jgi:hypothetical protein
MLGEGSYIPVGQEPGWTSQSVCTFGETAGNLPTGINCPARSLVIISPALSRLIYNHTRMHITWWLKLLSVFSECNQILHGANLKKIEPEKRKDFYEVLCLKKWRTRFKISHVYWCYYIQCLIWTSLLCGERYRRKLRKMSLHNYIYYGVICW